MSLAFRIVCPYCAEPTRAPAEAFYRWWPTEGIEPTAEHDDPAVTAAVASYCPECEGLVSLLVKGKDSVLRPIMADNVEPSEWGHYQADLELEAQYPERVGRQFSEAVPAVIRNALPDLLEDVSRQRNSAASLVTCGAILEVALKELEKRTSIDGRAKNLSLVQRIDQLRDAGIITSAIADWAHEIRLDRNAGAHELVGDPALAFAYANFLKTFIDMGFEWPQQIEAIRHHKNRKTPPKPGSSTA